MGLLEKAIAWNDAVAAGEIAESKTSTLPKRQAKLVNPQSVIALVADFHDKNPSFHCIVLQAADGNTTELVKAIGGMINPHGAVCTALPGGKCLALLPDGLDAELFAHRLSGSTSSTVLFQSSANVYSIAIDALGPYLT